MPNTEPGARSFLLRALPESRAGDPAQTTWRGYVTALPYGTTQCYFERLDQIPQVVAELLAENAEGPSDEQVEPEARLK